MDEYFDALCVVFVLCEKRKIRIIPFSDYLLSPISSHAWVQCIVKQKNKKQKQKNGEFQDS